MAVYRYYLVAASGRLAAMQRLRCDSDIEARQLAKDALLESRHPLVEVWDDRRKVAMLRNHPLGEIAGRSIEITAGE